MSKITLHKLTTPTTDDPWLRAIERDYSVPKPAAAVFVGHGLGNDRVAVWVAEDGSGAVDAFSNIYAAASEAASNGDYGAMSNHSGVDVLDFESGEIDPTADSMTLEVCYQLF